MFKVRRALVSVSDKRNLIDFARGLADLGVEIVSTGGTCRQLQDAGIDAILVGEALMRDGVCRCDVDEWVEAKVMEPHRRATELVAQAERVIAEPPTVEMLCRTDGGS